MADDSEIPPPETHADSGKDVKAEEIGEPVRFCPSFFCHYFLSNFSSAECR
jgi:hypothetical protein